LWHHIREAQETAAAFLPLLLPIRPGDKSQLLTGFDVIMDGTDNYQARFVMNDVAKKNGIPFAFGSVAGAYGMSKMFLPDEKICLRDVVGDSLDVSNAPTAATGGLISPILGVVTAFMAAETIKVLTGASDKVERRLMVFDLWQNQWSQLYIAENPQCEVCSGKTLSSVRGRFLGRWHERNLREILLDGSWLHGNFGHIQFVRSRCSSDVGRNI